jgi:hypothetical protein
LVLWTIYRLNPEKVRFQATLTRWLSIDLEMQSPRCGTNRPELSPRPAGQPVRPLRRTVDDPTD